MNIKPLAIAILVHLSRSPGREFYVREIARITGGSLGGCHKGLTELQRAGLVESRKSGRNLYYRQKETVPAIKHFKIFASLMELGPTVELLRPISSRVVLFGSCALGTDTTESDIDLLIVTDEPGKARAAVRSASLSRKVQALVLTPGQMLMSREKDAAFHSEVDKGIVLHRSDDGRI